MMDSRERLMESFNMLDNSHRKMWDMWRAAQETLSWTQEQLKSLTEKQMDRNKAGWEGMTDLVGDLSQQMYSNQAQFQNMVGATAMNTCEHVNHTSQSLMSDLNAKGYELSKKFYRRQS